MERVAKMRSTICEMTIREENFKRQITALKQEVSDYEQIEAQLWQHLEQLQDTIYDNYEIEKQQRSEIEQLKEQVKRWERNVDTSHKVRDVQLEDIVRLHDENKRLKAKLNNIDAIIRL